MGLASQVLGQPPLVSGSMGKRGYARRWHGCQEERGAEPRGKGVAGAQVRLGRGKGAVPRDSVEGGGGCRGGGVSGCVPAARGPEGGAREGGGPASSTAQSQRSGRSPSAWREVGRRLSAPGAGCNQDAAKERLVWANGAGVRGKSSVEEQHLPPGVEMGRNGPEHRPGSETPRPLLGSGRRAGRKSVTLTPPLPQLFPRRSPLLSAFTPQGGRGRA